MSFVAVTQQPHNSRCWVLLHIYPVSSRGIEMHQISRHMFDTMVVFLSYLDFTSDGSKRDPKLVSICCLDLADPITLSWSSSYQGKINHKQLC